MTAAGAGGAAAAAGGADVAKMSAAVVAAARLHAEIAQLEQAVTENRAVAVGLRNANKLDEALRVMRQVSALEAQLATLRSQGAMLG